MVDEARAKAREVIDALLPFAEKGIAIVGLEPSCLLTLRDEMLAMGLGEGALTVAGQALLFEEFLAREAAAGRLDALKSKLEPAAQPILLHGHCHQKAFAAVTPIMEVLRLIPGARPELIESSCCGMAGSFGYEASHYDVSHADGRTEPAARGAQAGPRPSSWPTAPVAATRFTTARNARPCTWPACWPTCCRIERREVSSP